MEVLELITSGQAEYKTYSGIGSGAFTLPCPEGKQIFLLDFDFTTGQEFVTINNFLLMYFRFQTINGKKSNVISFYPPGAQRNGGIANGTNYYRKINFAYQEDVRINSAVQHTDWVSTDFAVLSPMAYDTAAPGGYGTTVPALRSIELTPGDFYLPQGFKYTGFPMGAGFKDQPFPNIIAGSTAPGNMATSANGFSFNIGYLVINKPQSTAL